MTSENIVIEYLKSRKLNCVKHKSLKGLFYYLSAGCVVGTGTNFPSLSYATGSKTLKICIHHGSGPRTTNAVDGVAIKSQHDLIRILNHWDYFNFSTYFMSTLVGKLQFLLPNDKRIVLGYPRCDHLLDKNICSSKLENKITASNFIKELKGGDRIILYSPTWRFDDRSMSFPLALLSGFSIEELDIFLEKSNAYMLISLHPLMTSQFNLANARRIKFLPRDPLFDVNMLLPEVDVLISDYSSIVTDFLLMNRPVIYLMPDYSKYLNEIGLLEDFRLDNPGIEAFSFAELLLELDNAMNYPILNSGSIARYLLKYYDVTNTNSCQKFQDFILSRLQN